MNHPNKTSYSCSSPVQEQALLEFILNFNLLSVSPHWHHILFSLNINHLNIKNHQLSKTQKQNMNNPIQIWAKDLDRHFSKADIGIANKHIKRCSISLIFREMQAKTTMRYHLTSIRMSTIKKTKQNRK